MLNGKSLLITGGTGSFGKAFVKATLEKYPKIKRLVVFSRDELKQFEMSQVFSEKEYPSIRYFIGDIRDKNRLKRAFEDIDIVIHAAALKQVPAAEYNPTEFIHTNIGGAENIVEASLDTGVKRVIALSTDKAAAPINLYGATKLCSDKLFVAANNYKGSRDLRLSVVRYGNVFASRGSVIPLFLDKAKTGTLEITHPDMTRFNILLSEGVDMVFWALENTLGGEIFVPKIPSYQITDVAEAIGPSCDIKVMGIRPGEKLHEEMITISDSFSTYDLGKYYAILQTSQNHKVHGFKDKFKVEKLDYGFSYNSQSNSQKLSIDDIRKLIINNLDKDFKPY